MNIILFGPPGVGKSTLIGILKSRGSRAIDLEDVFPSSIRFQLPSMVDGVVFGGADLNPQRKYHNAMKVFLSLDQEQYEARRRLRDSKQPGKASQQQHLVANWLKGVNYDAVVDASGSPRKTASRVEKLMKKGASHEAKSGKSTE